MSNHHHVQPPPCPPPLTCVLLFHSVEAEIIAQKLTAFLETFDESYHEMISQAELEQTPLSVEKLYGDCSDVLITLFNDFERYGCPY